MKKNVLIAVSAFAVLLILVIIIAAQAPANTSAIAANHLKSLEWDFDKKPLEKVIITLPAKFDDVFTAYNKLQREAGFNLEDYAGKPVTRYTFTINNFFDIAGVRANVLVYSGKVIGGDLMTVAIDGFMLPLKKRADTKLK